MSKRLKLYDGDEEGFVIATVSVNCPVCSSINKLNISAGVSASKVDSQRRDKMLADISNVKETKVGDYIFYKIDGLPVCFYSTTCSECTSYFTSVLGVGEYQPCRYMAILAGIFNY